MHVPARSIRSINRNESAALKPLRGLRGSSVAGGFPLLLDARGRLIRLGSKLLEHLSRDGST